MTKKKLRKRITQLEDELTEARLQLIPTFETVTICWKERTVRYQGRTMTGTEADCLAFPVLVVQ